MEVYNQDKTKILKEYDREKGEIISDTITIHHEAVTGVPAKGHYEVIKEVDGNSYIKLNLKRMRRRKMICKNCGFVLP